MSTAGPSVDELLVHSSDSIPDFNAEAVGRVGGRVQIDSLELVGAEFTRTDMHPLTNDEEDRKPSTSGIRVEWSTSEERRQIGCVITFGTAFEAGVDAPYMLVASYRLIYSIPDADPLPPDGDVENFMHWNAVYNAWPYWREYLSSTMNRAGLPRFVLPIARMPLPGMASPTL